jgi:hypothetical protein
MHSTSATFFHLVDSVQTEIHQNGPVTDTFYYVVLMALTVIMKVCVRCKLSCFFPSQYAT